MDDLISVLSMLTEGVSPNTENASGITPLHKVRTKKFTILGIKKCIIYRYSKFVHEKYILFQCCMIDNQSAAEILLSHDALCNPLDDDWWTPLHYASEMDRSDLVQLLLQVRYCFLFMKCSLLLNNFIFPSENRLVC